MKRVGLWATIGIGIFITVGLITVEQGYAEEENHATTCTLETLKGRYLFGSITTLLPPAFGVTQQSLASSSLSERTRFVAKRPTFAPKLAEFMA